jgi:hypothetical protein
MDEGKVKAVYQQAQVEARNYGSGKPSFFAVYSAPWSGLKLGQGETKAEAWKNAADNL